MAKQRRKLRNLSYTLVEYDVDHFVMKNKVGSPFQNQPERVVTSSPLVSPNRSAFGMISVGTESFGNGHSPFFLHVVDHPCFSIVSHILDGINYNNWYIAMRISFDAKNKLAFVDGSLPRAKENYRLLKIWSRCNSMVKA